MDKKQEVSLKKIKALNELIGKLAQYYKVELNEVEKEIYVSELFPYKFKDIKKAASQLIRKNAFMPKVADFIKVLEEIEGKKPELAWYEIEKEIDRVGIYGEPSFKDPVVYAVVEAMGGWQVFCNMELDKVNFYRKEFIELYNAYKDKKEIINNALPETKRKEIAAYNQIESRALARGIED